LAPRPMDPDAVLGGPYASARHRDFLAVNQVDLRLIPDHELIRLVTEAPLLPSTPERPGWVLPPSHSLPGLTALGIPRHEPSYRIGRTPDPERGQHDEAYVRWVVVVGDAASVPDLCLAWNLRAQRTTDWPFPIWIDPAWFDDAAIVHRIRRAQTFS